jgi:hypothetical protein
MQILAFAATRRAVLEDAGGVTAEGFPMTSCYVESFPAQLNLPIVLSVYAPAGDNFVMRRYLGVTSPAGDRVGFLELSWEWPDLPNAPVKYRVLAPVLPMFVDRPGSYSIGLYADAAGSEPEFSFPLSVLAAAAN